MLCEKCKRNQAVTHIRQNINGNLTEMHLCQECAAEVSGKFENEYSKLFSDFGFGIDSMLTSIFGQDFLSENLLSDHTDRCEMCGSSLDEIRKSGNVGCKQCYEHFGKELMPLIQRIHGKTAHNGKVPQSLGAEITAKAKISELEKELQNAVEAQEFEKAAQLRDQINSLKHSL